MNDARRGISGVVVHLRGNPGGARRHADRRSARAPADQDAHRLGTVTDRVVGNGRAPVGVPPAVRATPPLCSQVGVVVVDPRVHVRYDDARAVKARGPDGRRLDGCEVPLGRRGGSRRRDGSRNPGIQRDAVDSRKLHQRLRLRSSHRRRDAIDDPQGRHASCSHGAENFQDRSLREAGLGFQGLDDLPSPHVLGRPGECREFDPVGKAHDDLDRVIRRRSRQHVRQRLLGSRNLACEAARRDEETEDREDHRDSSS